MVLHDYLAGQSTWDIQLCVKDEKLSDIKPPLTSIVRENIVTNFK